MRIGKIMIGALAVLLLLSVFPSCTPQVETPPSGTTGSFAFPAEPVTWYGPLGEAAFLTDDLFFFLSLDRHILSCSDLNTGITVALCSKTTCTHENEYCEAYIFGDQFTPIFFWNDGIYYTELDGYGTHLYRRNADGSSLSEVAILCEAEMEKADVDIFVDYSILADGKFYFGATIYTVVVLEDDALQHQALKSQICCVDLKTGKQTVIVDSPGNEEVICLLAAGGNSVVYSREKKLNVSSTDPNYAQILKDSTVTLIRADENTKKQAVILEKTRAEFQAPKFYDGCIVYNQYDYDSNDHRTAFDLNTGEEFRSMLMGVSIINLDYGLKAYWDTGSRTNHVVEMKTDTRLPLELPGNRFQLMASSGKGLVVKMTEFDKYDEYPNDENALYYVPINALSDGIQPEDALKLYAYRA